MYRWKDANSLFPKPDYKTPMNTDGYLSRFKLTCETAGFGDQVLHSLRRGAARDTKNAPGEGHHGTAKIASALGHTHNSKDRELSDEYGLQESTDEYTRRLAHAAKQEAPVFDYTGFLGDSPAEGVEEEDAERVVSKTWDFPIGGKFAVSTAQNFDGKRKYPPHTNWDISGRTMLRAAFK